MQQNIDRIREIAYEYYLQRGKIDGKDIEDWLNAEKEILKQNSNKSRISNRIKKIKKKK